jgi:hypothetical protein
VADQLEGGTGAVDGDQQVAPLRVGDLADRLGQHGEVIGGGVRAGVAGPQLQGQGFAGVVTPRGQGMVAVGALERARRAFLVRVRDLDGGVHADHHRLPQIDIGDPRRGDPSQPSHDQAPHAAADPGTGGGDVPPLRLTDRVQGAPRGRVGGDRAIELGLIPQRGQVRQHPAAVSDADSEISQHPTPVVDGGEPAPGQRGRQTGGETGVVGDQTQHRRSGVRHDPVPIDFHDQILRPRAIVHLKSAPRSGLLRLQQSHHPSSGALFSATTRSTQDHGEYRRSVAVSHRLRTALLSVGQSELVAGCPCVLLSACAVSAGDVSGPPSAVQDHPGRAIPAPWPVLGGAGRCQPETLDPASGPWQRREMDAVSTAGGIEARSGVDISRAR